MPEHFILSGLPAEEYPELESTNSFLKSRAKDASGELAVIALSQTGGRGRLGRSFFSPGGGLYLSALLRNLPENFYEFITPAAAVAVAEALEECGSERASIKWVNDIYIREKKVCGILAETANTPDRAVIVGIGVNLIDPPGGFPKEIRDRAGAAFLSPSPNIRRALAEIIIRNLKREIPQKPDLTARYRSRSNLIGKEVTVIGPKTYPATVLGIDDAFRLIVSTAGVTRTLNAGEVSVKM